MKKYSFYVGVDVSKCKLDVVILPASAEGAQHFVVGNDQKGIAAMLKRLEKSPLASALFCFEDTGAYSMPLCCLLSDRGAHYWMVPALEIKRSMGITRGKTDKADAKAIAFYALSHEHKLRLGRVPEKQLMKLRVLLTEREKLLKSIQLFQGTEETSPYLPKEVTATLLKINRSTLASLRKSLLAVERSMLELVESDSVLRQQHRLLNSIPGIGVQTSLYLMVITRGFSRFDGWRQLACYCGTAPFAYSSGSSVRGRTKVSPLADKKLKSLLSMCALSAKKSDPQLRAYYERKLKEGKPKMLVLNNIKCKLLARAFAVVARGEVFINTYKFAA